VGSPAYAFAVRILTKKDIEVLMATYDADPVGSICTAVGTILEVSVTNWQHMMSLLPPSYARSNELTLQKVAAMDSLVKQLVEHRTL